MSNQNLYTSGLKTWQAINAGSITEPKATNLDDEYFQCDFTIANIGTTDKPWDTQTVNNIGDPAYVGELSGSGALAFFQFPVPGVYSISIKIECGGADATQFVQFQFTDIVTPSACDLSVLLTGTTDATGDTVTFSGLIVPEVLNNYKVRARRIATGPSSTPSASGCLWITRIK